ncbi:MAG: hypothetical protein KAJ14_04745 [Candidatus Omnitrophica bacterium]|nr:hypothetical protein [Candidatus Omnitrophota bacterium]
MKNFLNQIFSGEITGVNVFAREETQENQRVVMYGHTEQNHLSLLLEELRKYNLLTKHSITKRKTVYLWDENWIPSENTHITSTKERDVAVESGFLVKFFPPKNLEKPLINFLIKRCYKNGSDSIEGAWVVPYIATNKIKHPEFFSTKEIVLKGNDGTIQSSFVPDKFKTRFTEIRQKLLFRSFAEFIGA